MTREESSPPFPIDKHLGQYEPSPSALAAFDELLDWVRGLTREELAIAARMARQMAEDSERREALRRQASERREALKRQAATIKRIEKDAGKNVTGITIAPDGSATYTFDEATPSEAPSSSLTADDELAAWRRKHAR